MPIVGIKPLQLGIPIADIPAVTPVIPNSVKEYPGPSDLLASILLTVAAAWRAAEPSKKFNAHWASHSGTPPDDHHARPRLRRHPLPLRLHHQAHLRSRGSRLRRKKLPP